MSGAAMHSTYDGVSPDADISSRSFARRNMFFTLSSRCLSRSGSNRENAPPSVVSYPGHTHATAAKRFFFPLSPLYRTASPVPALSPYPNSGAFGNSAWIPSRWSSKASEAELKGVAVGY